MILTTSPSIEGSPIKAYIRPVSSHVVLGTNIFSDFAATFRDIVGGRSESYQKQLRSLTDAVLKELEGEAKRLKADAVIGIDIDYSDISGGGKASMLMAVATGTAVSLEQKPTYSVSENLTVIDHELMSKEIRKLELIAASRMSPDQALSNHDELVEEQVHEVADVVIPELIKANYLQALRKYIRMCSTQKGYSWTLETALEHEVLDVRGIALTVLTEQEEFRLRDLIPFASTRSKETARSFFAAACIDQAFYSSSDLKPTRELREAVEKNFPKTALTEVVKTITGKEKEINRCECGGVIDEVANTCKTCHLNAWGLPKSKYSPDDVIGTLRPKEEVLARLIGGVN